jgi:hypothetical protein
LIWITSERWKDSPGDAKGTEASAAGCRTPEANGSQWLWMPRRPRPRVDSSGCRSGLPGSLLGWPVAFRHELIKFLLVLCLAHACHEVPEFALLVLHAF